MRHDPGKQGRLGTISEALLLVQDVLYEHSLVLVLELLALFQVVFDKGFLERSCFCHLGFHVDDPGHYFLVFSVDPFRLSFLGHVVEGFGSGSLDPQILLVNDTLFAF